MEFEFSSNAELDTLDNVPEVYRGLYTQANGKYTIAEAHRALTATIDGLGSNLKAAKNNLTKANGESKTHRESLQGLLKAAGVDNAEGLTAKLADLEGKIAAGATVKPEEIRAAVEADWKGKLQGVEDKNAKLSGTLQKLLVDNEAISALAEAKGSTKLLVPLIKSMTKVIEDENGDYIAVVTKPNGDVRANASGSPMTIAELVAEMKKDPDLKTAFVLTEQSGGGQQTQQRSTQAAVQNPTTGVGKIAAGLAARR